jgi:hypothetical protein
MSPAASAAEMLRTQARAIAAAAEAWEKQYTQGMAVAGVGATPDDVAATAAAAAGSLGALQRSLQGSLAAGVNGGIPTMCAAFFPEVRPAAYPKP